MKYCFRARRGVLRGGPSSPSLLRLREETDVGTVVGRTAVAVLELRDVLVREVVVVEGRGGRGGGGFGATGGGGGIGGGAGAGGGAGFLPDLNGPFVAGVAFGGGGGGGPGAGGPGFLPDLNGPLVAGVAFGGGTGGGCGGGGGCLGGLGGRLYGVALLAVTFTLVLPPPGGAGGG